MKQAINIAIMVLISIQSYGQDTMRPLTHQDTVLVSDIKTTHLIFDEKVTYLDLGSPYFVADTLNSMIKLKHTGQKLSNSKSKITNLTVITTSGMYYSLALTFDRNTEIVTYKMNKSQENIKMLQKERKIAEERIYEFKQLCGQVKMAKSNYVLREHRDELKIRVTGIFYQEEHLAVRIEIDNGSTIDLDIDQILIRLKLGKKYQADYIYQERIVNPVEICDKNFKIKGHQSHKMTLIFDKFTPNKNEKLFIDVLEANGGRSVTIDIPRRIMLKPKTISL